jgi:hypothetical protein
MTTILEILLYLALIGPNGTYTNAQIQDICNANQQAIQTVQSDPNQMSTVSNQFNQPSTSVIIVNPKDDP